MNDNKLIHVLKPGQELSIKWRKREGFIKDVLTNLKLTSDNNGNPYANAYVVFVDSEGLSIYINRGYSFGGDLEIYISKKDVAWQEYFEPLDSYNQSYVRYRHYLKKFPHEFI